MIAMMMAELPIFLLSGATWSGGGKGHLVQPSARRHCKSHGLSYGDPLEDRERSLVAGAARAAPTANATLSFGHFLSGVILGFPATPNFFL